MLNTHDLNSVLAVHPVLSLYLNVDPGTLENQASTPAWQIWLKNALKDIESHLNDADTNVWQTLRARLNDFLENYTPNSKGLVLFLGDDLEQVYELPVTLENRAAFGKPAVAPLLWAMDEYEPYLIVLVDREKADFLLAQLGKVQHEDNLIMELHVEDWREMTLMPSTTGQVRAGSHRDRFAVRMTEQLEHFYQNIATRARELAKKHGINRFILGGSQESAHALQHLMSHDNVVGIIPTLSTYKPAEVLQKAQPIAENYERKQEMELVEEIINLAKSGGRGALGYHEVALALKQGRVELLLASWSAKDARILDDLLVQALQAGAKIELAHGEPAERLNLEGGVAARLYYAL